MSRYQEAKQRLLNRLRYMLEETEQLRNDMEWWNNHRLDAQPFDVGREKVAISIIQQMIELVEADECIPSELHERLAAQLTESGI